MNSGSITANLISIAEERIFLAEIVWQNGLITHITELGNEQPWANYILPGFIDAHIHIESSLLPPAEFARMAVRHGTVATVSDPHEIANVLGLDGVRFMYENAALTPLFIAFGAPSCVPATPFETSGAQLESEELEPLFQQQITRYLSEVMNYPAVLAKNPQILAKLALAKQYHCPIDGHAPKLTGEAVLNYAQAGISTDHECSSLEEAYEKLAAGMSILIREGSAARNFEALHSLVVSHPEKVMFCSDDKHPDDLVAGHINLIVARAMAKGYPLFNVLRCACLNPIKHYDLPIGQLRVGDSMDAIEVSNLEDFLPINTWLAGQKVAAQSKSLLPSISSRPINCFNARPISSADLEIQASGQKIRVIKAMDGELFTQELFYEPKIEQQKIVPDLARDILFLVVVNRYQAKPPAVAFIEGFGLQQGALASSVAHDSHNVIAVGTDAVSICTAVNAIIAAHGGIAFASGERLELLPLPIAGLMSDADGDSVAKHYGLLNKLAKDHGSLLQAPFMTLSFMALLVIPELKLSDQGLFDARTFAFTSLTL